MVKSDSGPAFRQAWEEELEKMGGQVLHSSAYNAQSMGMVDMSMRTLKEILKKNNSLSQLELSEMIYAINCEEDGETGSAQTRFMG